MVRSHNLRRRFGAFMLVDVLAALALIAGTIMLAVVFFRTQVREVRGIHERFAARLIAESEMERLRTLPYGVIPVGAKQPRQVTFPSAMRLKEARVTLDVQEIESGLKRARVLVQWSSRAGKPRRAELTGEFSREGLPRD